MASWFTTIVLVVFSLYTANLTFHIYSLFNPINAAEGEPAISNMFSLEQRFDAFAFTSTSLNLQPQKSNVIWSGEDLGFDQITEAELNITLPKSILTTKDLLYVHLILCRAGRSPWNSDPKFKENLLIHAAAAAIRYQPLQQPKATKKLIGASTINSTTDVKEKDLTPHPHWKSKMTFHLVADQTRYSRNSIPVDISVNMRLAPGDSSRYLPVLQIDELSLTTKHLLPLTVANISTPVCLHLFITPVSLGWWRLRSQFNMVLNMLGSMMQDQSESDQIRSMMTDTSPWLLILTFTVALFHMLFDILAFKNDISHWRELKRSAGISQRALLMQSCCQVVVFFYLWDNETSLLVLGPAAFSIFLSFWKLWRLRFLNTSAQQSKPSGTTQAQKPSAEALTAQYDDEAMRWLSIVIFPLLLAYTVYALLYKEYPSWWSFLISTAAGWVYAFGFVLMTPQLFINYRLKTVAHLPFRVFMYRLFNTVIDDFFSFIIPMPMLHRISVFRDDIIFLAYLYQRWIYPVDKTRTAALDDGVEHEKKIS